MGHKHWPLTQVTHSYLLSHDPLTHCEFCCVVAADAVMAERRWHGSSSYAGTTDERGGSTGHHQLSTNPYQQQPQQRQLTSLAVAADPSPLYAECGRFSDPTQVETRDESFSENNIKKISHNFSTFSRTCFWKFLLKFSAVAVLFKTGIKHSHCIRKQQQQHPFNGTFSGTTNVNRYQNGKHTHNGSRMVKLMRIYCSKR